MSGILYLVATPIGNKEDISLRALRVLKEVDYVICEEWKNGKSLLKYYGIENELLRLSEHNMEEGNNEILTYLKSGKSLALTSDCGTPVFSDPGYELVKLAYKNDIKTTTVPGANSLLPAIILSGFNPNTFKSLGWLPRKKEERESALKKIIVSREPTVIMETPYRLLQLLESIEKVLGFKRQVAICMNLTMEDEKIVRGQVGKIRPVLIKEYQKSEFVCIVGPS
jgi:16S rRNA (cytidine1402-2'-O)-methyltransferase